MLKRQSGVHRVKFMLKRFRQILRRYESAGKNSQSASGSLQEWKVNHGIELLPGCITLRDIRHHADYGKPGWIPSIAEQSQPLTHCVCSRPIAAGEPLVNDDDGQARNTIEIVEVSPGKHLCPQCPKVAGADRRGERDWAVLLIDRRCAGDFI